VNTPESIDGDLLNVAADNLVLHMTWVQARVSGMHASIGEFLTLADAGLGTDTFNTVCRARLQSNDSARIRDAIAYFENRGQPFSWWVGPGDTPEHLSGMLEQAGLLAAESEMAMAARLDRLAAIPAAPAGLSIERVRTPAQLRDFATINAENWSPPDPAVGAFYEKASAELLAEGSPLWLYVGYLASMPAATAEVAVSGRAAGLYNVSTRADYRRRGIGMAMTLQPLFEARAAGVELGILQAASEGMGVYRRAGFHPFGEYREFKPAWS
jgi:GNAT superfamily N-acetyltransferase